MIATLWGEHSSLGENSLHDNRSSLPGQLPVDAEKKEVPIIGSIVGHAELNGPGVFLAAKDV
jgi:hypothetical protein